MKYRTLLKTGLQVSEVGFGCMSLHKNDEAESIRLMHQALDAGINYFDTADIYDGGANEELVGKALCGHREKIILATKVGNVIKPGGSKGFNWNPSKEHILRSIEGSLKRLRTDRIDIYQLHGGTINDPFDETIEAFELLKQQGKILHYGISSIRPNVIREYVKRSNIVCVMTQYSLLDRRPEEEVLDLLHENNIGVIARGVLAQGLLVNKPPKKYLQHTDQTVNNTRNALAALTGEKVQNTGAAIGFALHHKAVTSAVIGFRTSAQLRDALTPFSLSNEELAALQTAVPAIRYGEHR